MKKTITLISFLIVSFLSFGQDVKVKNNVFEVLYSQDLEQPLWIKYRSTNRPTNVNRGSMDFYKINKAYISCFSRYYIRRQSTPRPYQNSTC